MAMQLILTRDVDQLGKAGELVTVKNGYGRNFLLPKGYALTATKRNVAELEHNRAMIAARVARERADAESVANRLNGMTLQFERLVGDEDKMFGSVTVRDLANQLEVAGVKLDARKIKLEEPIKALGKYEVPVKLGSNVEASLKFWVVGKSS